MSDEQPPTGEITQRFRAFVARVDHEDPKRSLRLAIAFICAGAAVVAVAVILWIVVA